jgi:hypothetical protein
MIVLRRRQYSTTEVYRALGSPDVSEQNETQLTSALEFVGPVCGPWKSETTTPFWILVGHLERLVKPKPSG